MEAFQLWSIHGQNNCQPMTAFAECEEKLQVYLEETNKQIEQIETKLLGQKDRSFFEAVRKYLIEDHSSANSTFPSKELMTEQQILEIKTQAQGPGISNPRREFQESILKMEKKEEEGDGN